jgi:hypothetical protein
MFASEAIWTKVTLAKNVSSFLFIFSLCLCCSCSLKIANKNTPANEKLNFDNKSDLKFNNPLYAYRQLITNDIDSNLITIIDQVLFKSIIDDIKEYDFQKAEQNALKLYSLTKDDSIKQFCQKIYYDLLFFQSKWQELLNFDSANSSHQDDVDNILILAKVFNASPKEKIRWENDSSTIQFSESPTGCPIIPCFVNGNLKYFWFDSGANYNVLSSQIADECGVHPPIKQYSKALTGTIRKIDIYPATINELKIGSLIIENSPTVIVHDFDMKMKFFGSSKTTKIDGIIGWKSMLHATICLNYPDNLLILSKPRKYSINGPKNFFWLACPIVQFQSDNGIPLIMALDFGSEKTSITQNIFNKISFDHIYQQVKPQNSAGGSVYFNSSMISRLSVKIDSKDFSFYNIGTTFQVPSLFVILDGIIGIDFFKEAVIKMDLVNGRFDILNY